MSSTRRHEADRSYDELREGSKKATGPLNATLVGLFLGVALGFAGAFGGFEAFIVVLVVAAAGVVVGLVLDGRIDLSKVLDRDND